jgi:hypothetical protein
MIHNPATHEKKQKLESLFKKPGEASSMTVTLTSPLERAKSPSSFGASAPFAPLSGAQPGDAGLGATSIKNAKDAPRRQCCGRVSYFQHLETCPYCGKRTLKAVLPKQRV